MTLGDTQQLARLVEQRRDLLARILELCQRQQGVIDAGDMTSLLEILSGKQRLLEDVQLIERALDPYRAERPESRRWRSEEDRRHCAAQVAHCDALYGEIVQHEKESERKLTLRRDEAAARLEGMHYGNHARGAYASEGQQHVSQFDLTSEA